MNKLTLTAKTAQKLARLKDPVHELSFIGSDLTDFDDYLFVAIVGSRKPTPYGRMITERIATELAHKGILIVSGLALGVDGIAHDACIKAGGKTIAVVASGLNNIGPAANKNISDKIITTGGSILSEYPPDHEPRKVEFLERNRIIAALSDAVLVTEAANHSGSLNTANHALKMHIPVCAVPGNITSPMSEGTNQLLKDGAHIVTTADDILKILGIETGQKTTQMNLLGDTPEETIILQKLGLGFTEAHALQIEAELTTVAFQTAITMLEVQGKVVQTSLGTWNLK